MNINIHSYDFICLPLLNVHNVFFCVCVFMSLLYGSFYVVHYVVMVVHVCPVSWECFIVL